jgi:hypothetical protein
MRRPFGGCEERGFVERERDWGDKVGWECEKGISCFSGERVKCEWCALWQGFREERES